MQLSCFQNYKGHDQFVEFLCLVIDLCTHNCHRHHPESDLAKTEMFVLHKSIICSFLVKVLQLLSWPKTSKNRQDQSRSCGAVEPVQIAFWTSPRPQLWLLTALNSPGRQLAKDLKETHRARPSPQCSECWNLLILRKGVRRLDPPTRDASLSLWMRANKFSHRFCISSKLSWLGTSKVPESSEAVLRYKVSHVSLVPQSHLSYAHLLHKKTGDWFDAGDEVTISLA